MSELNITGLKPGQNYRIIFQIPGVHYKPRETIMRYLGHDVMGHNELSFDLRPVAGTQSIKIDWIMEVWETDKPVFEPVIYRGEVRVF